MIGSYRIGPVLGEGGMGTVYLGHHTLIDRAVAIKMLSPALGHDDALIARFLDEARALAALRVPGVVELLDCGLLEDGRPFMILELLEGETLAQRLGRRGALALDEAIAIAREVAQILDTIHARGVVHRDLTPDNVFLTTDTPAPGVKLLDFGVAKAAAGASEPDLMIGTPAYMAPEQCHDPESVDHRADLYALGCVLFEMIAGYPPFGGDSPEEIVGAHERAPAPRLRDHVPAVPDELDALVASILAKRPEDRIPTASELARRLDACGRASGEGDHPPKAWASVRTHPTPVPPTHGARQTQSAPWPWWWVRTFVAVPLIALGAIA